MSTKLGGVETSIRHTGVEVRRGNASCRRAVVSDLGVDRKRASNMVVH